MMMMWMMAMMMMIYTFAHVLTCRRWWPSGQPDHFPVQVPPLYWSLSSPRDGHLPTTLHAETDNNAEMI